MVPVQFKSLYNIFMGDTGSGRTNSLLHGVLVDTNRHADVIAVIVSEECSAHNLTRVLMDNENVHSLGIDPNRTIFCGTENLMLVLRDVMPQGPVHLFVDAPNKTRINTYGNNDGSQSRVLRFDNARLNEAAEIVQKLSVTVDLTAL
jgi:hypothetical protein